MSTPPPPPFGAPTPGASGVLTPGAAPPKKSRAPIVIAAIVVIAAVAAGIFFVTRSDEKGGGGLASTVKTARTALKSTIDDADFNSDGTADLDRCPLGRMTKLDDLVSEEVDLGDLPDGDTSYQAKDATDVDPQLVLCGQYTVNFDNESQPFAIAYQALLDPPKNLEAYLNDAADAADETFEAGDPEPFQDGTIHRGCQGLDAAPTCTAVWANSNGGVAIAVVLYGAATDDSDASAALQQVLTTVLDNLAGK